MNVSKRVSILLTSGMYDAYKDVSRYAGTDSNLYSGLHTSIFPLLKSILSLVLNIGVYACVLAFIVGAVMLFLSSDRGPKALQEAKEHIIKLVVVSVLLGSALKIVVIIFKLGL